MSGKDVQVEFLGEDKMRVQLSPEYAAMARALIDLNPEKYGSTLESAVTVIFNEAVIKAARERGIAVEEIE